MSLATNMDEMLLLKEASWPITMIWERIIHAYSSDSPPDEWGIQKDDRGYQSWTFKSNNEKYTVLWDAERSYWKVDSPFGRCLYFTGPLIIDKSMRGLRIPPLPSIINSATAVLIPAHPAKVKEKMSQIDISPRYKVSVLGLRFRKEESMSVTNKEIDVMSMPEFQEACWPVMMIWERINHANTSDSPPKTFGLQKGDYGFQYWVFTSNTESYSVFWDINHSYWKVKTPFGPCLFLVGLPFIDKSGRGLQVPPLPAVTISDTDVLQPASPGIVKTKMLNIARFVSE